MTDELAGYWPGAWPGEDGGPTRRQAPHEGAPGAADPAGFGLGEGRTLRATTRSTFAPAMCVLRDPGEVFLLCTTLGRGCVSWVERIHPESLEVRGRSPDLDGGPFWPGGMLAHADGSLYVTFGRHCHRLDATTLQPIATRPLPRDRPYNSLLSLPGGQLVMKDIGGGDGVNRLPEDVVGSELVVLAPGSLDEIARLELPEGSIARLSADGDDVYVVGESRCHRVHFDARAGTLTRDETWSPRYRTVDGQTFGWDVVLAAGSGWFLDNGEGSDDFGGSFRGKGRSTAPLHLVRVPLDEPDPVDLVEVDGRVGGVIANPPAVDEERRVVVGYDSGHGTLAGWRFGEPGDALQPLWRRSQFHAGHMLRVPATGELLTYDFDHDRGTDQAVVLEIETGDELGRVDTGSPVQCVLFPAPAPGGAYVCTFAAVSRVYGE